MAVIICSLFLIVGCKKSGGNIFSSLDKEAEDYANKNFLNKDLVECDGFTYTRNFSGELFYYNKFKNRGSVVIESTPLTEADKMNGTEWQGSVTYKFDGPGQTADMHNPVYSEWRDLQLTYPNIVYKLKKQNGSWNYDGTWGATLRKLSTLTCEDVVNPKVFKYHVSTE